MLALTRFHRGLAGMMEELKDGEAGRPPQPPDPEKIRMEEKIAKLEAKVKELVGS